MWLFKSKNILCKKCYDKFCLLDSTVGIKIKNLHTDCMQVIIKIIEITQKTKINFEFDAKQKEEK